MSTDGRMDFKCPNCGGTMSFDPASGKLKCDYCDSAFSEEEVSRREAEQLLQQQNKESGADWQQDAEAMRAYSCSSCGAELLADANTAAICCPYCGSNTIATAQFSGAIRPDYVIPFAFTKKQAVDKYQGYYARRMLLPGSFSRSSHVDEIQGVYVPFWLFNGSVTADAAYEASDTVRDGDEEVTTYYDVQRRGTVSFENVPADASGRMDDALMDSLEPYDFSALKPFTLACLPGFLAERFDVEQTDNRKRAEERIRTSAENMVRDTIEHDDYTTKHETFDIHYGQTGYALLPAWILTTRWNGGTYTFAMNGQTGEFTGDLPVSKPKLAILTAIAFLIPLVILLLATDNTMLAVIAGLAVALIAAFAAHSSMKPVTKAYGASRYMSELHLNRQTDRRLREERKPVEKSGSAEEKKPAAQKPAVQKPAVQKSSTAQKPAAQKPSSAVKQKSAAAPKPAVKKSPTAQQPAEPRKPAVQKSSEAQKPSSTAQRSPAVKQKTTGSPDNAPGRKPRVK